ncbi:MAG: copper resistance protein B [Gammaproteobacteria bacterium]
MRKRTAPFIVALLTLASFLAQETAAADGVHTHMDDDPLVGMILVDELEVQNTSPDKAVAWNVVAWLGHDTGRLLFRSEGKVAKGDVDDSRAELLWLKPIAAWWDLVGGLRQDAGTGPGRTYGLIGLQGLTPYRFHVESDLFGGERGQVGMRLESSYAVLVTNRLILTPRAELQAFRKDDDTSRVGRGLSQLDLGLRLRYEIRREFAPYVGLEWSRKFGDTAGLAREADERVHDARVLAGLRFWF